MRAYLLDNQIGVYLVFAEDAESAGRKLASWTGCSFDSISVGGDYDVSSDVPISISSLWPYFTANPGRHADAPSGEVDAGSGERHTQGPTHKPPAPPTR